MEGGESEVDFPMAIARSIGIVIEKGWAGLAITK